MSKAVMKREAQLTAHYAQKAEYDAIFAGNKQAINACGELLSSIFRAEERIRTEDGHGKPEGGYLRRPPIGVRLEIGDRYLTAVPGFTHPRKRWNNGEISILSPGELHLDEVYVEVLIQQKDLKGKSVMLSANINEDGIKLCQWRQDPAATKMYIAVMIDTFKDLLDDPYKVFAQNSDHCSCCGKTLTDAISMTRGIGPECIRYFGHLEETIREIKEKYRDLDADWVC